MNLTILPPTLHFLQLPKSQLWAAMPAITSMLLSQGQQKGLFLNYTETLDEVSFLMDARSFSALLALLPVTLTGWSVSPGSFRAISVSEGESTHMTSFNVTTGLVASLSAILAENHVSIFYVSTFETDFVVIKQSQMALAIQVLKEKFGEESVEVEEDEEEEHGAEEGEGEPGEGEVEGQPSPSAEGGSTSSVAASTPALDPNAAVYLPCPTLSGHAAAIAASVSSTNSTLSASSSSAALSASKSVQVTSALQLYALPQTFFLAHWREEEVCTHIRSLLQLFFFPLGKSAVAAAASSSSASPKSPFASDRFFSYSNIDSAVSMQVDSASLALLQADHHLSMSFERWRAFQVAGTFGFEECGIVAALSGPLTRASICPYYISSFFTDVCFVQEAKWDHARAILEKEFKFVEREIRPKANTPALAAAGPASSAAAAAAASPHAGMHTGGVLHMPIPHPHHTTHQPLVFHTSTMLGAHPGQAVQSLALMRGISNTSTSSTGHSIASPAHTRGPSNLHSPAPVDNYAPVAASDVCMPILFAGGVSHTSSHSSNRGSSPSPYDAMGSGDAMGGMSRPISMPARTTSTGSVTTDPSPYDPIGPSGAVSPHGGAPVPLLMTHNSSYSTALAEPSPYDAVHAVPTHASPAHHAAPHPRAAATAAPSPYAAIGSTDINSAPMHVVPHAAVAAAPAPAVVSTPPVVASAPPATAPPAAAKPAGAFSLFASAALVMPSSPALSPAAPAPAAAAAASISPVAGSPSSHSTPFTAEALSAPVERLSCFRVSVDKAQSIQLLRLGESAAPTPAAAAANLYSADSSSPAAGAAGFSAPSAGDGLFLLRPCSDPSELLATGLPNPNLWVLCYNKKGSMIKTKVYRLSSAAGATQWSLGVSGHRLFPSLHAIISAVVGAHARPIA